MNKPPTSGKIIIINGPSSSGKTTLAFALQKQFDLPFLRFSFDHIIETKSSLNHLIQSVSALDVFFVGLHCSLPELERREIQRGNRRAGEARADLETVHSITSYDLELNSEDTLEQNANILINAWKKRKHPGALDKMIQEMNSETYH